MESSDGSAAIARKYVDRLFSVKAFPIAEPTRVAAARLARHNWILLVDPDEYLSAGLPESIQRILALHPDAGAVRLPMVFHFKGRPMSQTIWGGVKLKRRLIHRHRCALLPYCNLLTDLLPGQHEVNIDSSDRNLIRHYWSESYRDLLYRHLVRYPRLDAARMFAQGERFKLRRALWHPVQEVYRCLRHYDGWRMGLRGFLLSGIYFVYVAAFEWMLLCYRPRSGSISREEPVVIPTLVEQSVADYQIANHKQVA